MRTFAGRDVVSLKDWERSDYFEVFAVADELAPVARRRKKVDLLDDKILVVAFYQPSTRTRLATETAMHRLGGRVVGFSDATMTRAGDFFQESLRDTVRMLENYGDVIAMRHFQQGAPLEAATWSSVPVINCGDGWGEHPTQVLADLYTMWKEFGTLDRLELLCMGDMRMRTMHSLGYAASQFDMRLTLVAPDAMAASDEFKQELTHRSTRFVEAKSLADGLDGADVVYMEAVSQPDHAKSHVQSAAARSATPPEYRLTRDLLRDRGRPGVIVLHSLPRLDELPVEVDDTCYARYWVESFNGVLVRMALLALILDANP